MKKLGIIFTLCLFLTFLIAGATVAGSSEADGHVPGKDDAGSMTFTLCAGDPMLPHKVYNIAVPPGIDVTPVHPDFEGTTATSSSYPGAQFCRSRPVGAGFHAGGRCRQE